MTTRYLDFDGGNDSNNGSSFALRKKTLASVTSGLTGGDTVRVMASPDPTSLGQNATFTNGSDTVTLTTAVTATISNCETAWTPSANVTSTSQTTFLREGTNAARNDIASAFTTGLVAYTAFSATDFSAYQQISFLFYSGAAVAANVLQLKLCSDAAGATAVNTINLPAISAGYWTAVCVDTGAALGSSIQSVALYAASDPGAINTVIDNIIACKASSADDSLTHYSLIGKNTGTEPWMAIDSINGTTIKLAGGYQSTASRTGFQPYYYGSTATQTIYKREPIILTAAQVPSNGSSQDSPINIEGGWDRTAMTTQSGQTFCRMRDPNATCLSASTTSYCYVNKWYSVNCNGAGFLFNQGWTLGEVGAIACAIGFQFYQCTDTHAMTAATRYCMHCVNAIDMQSTVGSTPNEVRLKWTYMWGTLKTNSTHYAIADNTNGSVCGKLLVNGCDFQGHYGAIGDTVNLGKFYKITFKNCTFANMSRRVGSYAPLLYFIGCTITSVTEIINSDSTHHYVNNGGVTTDHSIAFGQYVASGSVASDTSTRHTASDYAWKLSSTGVGSSFSTVPLSIAKIACVANEQRTVTAWMRRSSTSLTVRLRVKGGFWAGIDTDATAAMTAAINTWEQVTLQFTPTEQCVVEVFAECYGTTADAWVDDLGVS